MVVNSPELHFVHIDLSGLRSIENWISASVPFVVIGKMPKDGKKERKPKSSGGKKEKKVKVSVFYELTIKGTAPGALVVTHDLVATRDLPHLLRSKHNSRH